MPTKIILDTQNPFLNARIVTFEVELPRCVWPEVLTHRAFSRNSASSRAIPFNKTKEDVISNGYTPVKWGSNKKGMQPGDEIDQIEEALKIWNEAKNSAIEYAQKLHDLGLHKQIVNRLMEPFMMHKAIITATDFENFFYLRDNEMAEINVTILARDMKRLYDSNTPVEREFHLPYTDDLDEDYIKENPKRSALISAGRCARISYLTHDGSHALDKQVDLATELMLHRHMSPFEHQARASYKHHYHGNFYGFLQMRKFMNYENVTRRIKPLEKLPVGLDDSFFEL